MKLNLGGRVFSSLISAEGLFLGVCVSSRKEAAQAGPALSAAEILAGAQLLGLIFHKQAPKGFRFAAWWSSHFSTLLFFPLSGLRDSAPRGFSGFRASYLSDLGFCGFVTPTLSFI